MVSILFFCVNWTISIIIQKLQRVTFAAMGRQPEQDDSETETEPEELSADPKQEL